MRNPRFQSRRPRNPPPWREGSYLPGSLAHQSFAFWDAILLTPVDALLRLAGRSARRLLQEILRRRRMKELRPTPSLSGTPKPADIDEIWIISPRTLLDRLRIGSRLLDLEPSVDNSFVFQENPISGRKKIIARHSGVKGWLRLHCPAVAYTTAMAFKKLASRLKTLCGAPANVPLEWLLPDAPEISALTSDPVLADAIAAARRRLDGFLAEGKTFTGLQALVEKQMKIVRLPSKNIDFSLICDSSAENSGRECGRAGGKGHPVNAKGRKWDSEGKKSAEKWGGAGVSGRRGPKRPLSRAKRRTELRRRRHLDTLPQQLETLAEALRQSEIDPRNVPALRQLAALLRL